MRTKANLVRSSLGSAAWQDYGGNTACVCGGGGSPLHSGFGSERRCSHVGQGDTCSRSALRIRC